MNNEHFAHTTDPAFSDALQFNSVGIGRQLPHHWLIIRTQSWNNIIQFPQKSWRQVFTCSYIVIKIFFSRTIGEMHLRPVFLSLQCHFLHKSSILLSIFCQGRVCSACQYRGWLQQQNWSTNWMPCPFELLTWKRNGNKKYVLFKINTEAFSRQSLKPKRWVYQQDHSVRPSTKKLHPTNSTLNSVSLKYHGLTWLNIYKWRRSLCL